MGCRAIKCARAAAGTTFTPSDQPQKCLIRRGFASAMWSAGELASPIPLEVKQRGQVAMSDPGASRRSDNRLRVKGDAEAGALDHSEIIGAVPDRKAEFRRKPAFAKRVFQNGELGFA